MRKRTVATAAGLGIAAAVVAGGVAVAGNEAGEEGSNDYTQQQADDATRAALQATGGSGLRRVSCRWRPRGRPR